MIPPLSFMSVSEGVVVTGLVIVLFVFIYWTLRLDFENRRSRPIPGSVIQDEELASVPWWRLRGAYGSSAKVPQIIRDLDSGDEDRTSDAIDDGLWSHIIHQYTIYPVTPYATPFVTRTLLNPNIRLKPKFMDYLRQCAEYGDAMPFGSMNMRDGLLAARDVFHQLLKDEDPQI